MAQSQASRATPERRTNLTGCWMIVCFLIVPLVAAYSYLIWPTPYILTEDFPVVLRVNRFTGETQISSRTGWVPVSPADAAKRKSLWLKSMDVTSQVYVPRSFRPLDPATGYASVPVKNTGKTPLSAFDVFFIAKDAKGESLNEVSGLVLGLAPTETERVVLDELPYGTDSLLFERATALRSPADPTPSWEYSDSWASKN